MGADTTTLIIKYIKNGRTTYSTLVVQAAENFEEYGYFLWRLYNDSEGEFRKTTRNYEKAYNIASKIDSEYETEYGIKIVDYTNNKSNIGVSFTNGVLQLTKEQWVQAESYNFSNESNKFSNDLLECFNKTFYTN